MKENPRWMTIEEIIGNTPLVKLQHLAPPRSTVLVKLEGNNPAGSVKDRPALWMVRKAEERGRIRPGDRLIEATSGNTGIALAMAAALRGYRMTLIMPENSSQERVDTMRAYGAEVLLTPKAGGMEAAIDLARAMEARGEGIILDQFSNPDNPLSHYESTGPEIWDQTAGLITHFVASTGTTGTLMGTGRFLKEKNPQVTIVGVRPAEGATIPGIRKWPEEYLPKIYRPEQLDQTLDVTTAQAEDTTRILAAKEGILAGISSGGNVFAALRVAEENPGSVVVAIICDRGDRYLSTGIFSSR